MRRRTGSIICVLAVCLTALAGCERREAIAPQPPADAAFRHQLSGDLSGEYRALPQAPSAWRVDALFVGQAAAFEAWEAGSQQASPLILSLSGPDGATQVLPHAYRLSDDRLKMSGAAPGGQALVLDLRISQGALATARRNLGDQTAVMTGALTVDGRAFPVELTWWGGD